mmetsp:Transcript_34776/g.97081  ORF Transcript_34776/g.97081 Transcript_34776/m.97081 type:complete len:216 (-) Transcript_34776:943-1590(-)
METRRGFQEVLASGDPARSPPVQAYRHDMSDMQERRNRDGLLRSPSPRGVNARAALRPSIRDEAGRRGQASLRHEARNKPSPQETYKTCAARLRHAPGGRDGDTQPTPTDCGETDPVARISRRTRLPRISWYRLGMSGGPALSNLPRAAPPDVPKASGQEARARVTVTGSASYVCGQADRGGSPCAQSPRSPPRRRRRRPHRATSLWPRPSSTSP